MRTPQSPRSLLLHLALGLLWMGALWVLAGPLLASADFPGEWKLDLITGLALVPLVLGTAVILFALKNRLKTATWLVPLLIGSASLLPAAAVLVPRWLVNRYLLLQPDLVSPDYWRNALIPQPPWILIFQVTLSTVLLPVLLESMSLPKKITWPQRLPDWVFPSILAGMGLWLLGAFSFSLLLQGLKLPQPVLPPLSPRLGILVWGTALLVAPFTQEILFRRLLIRHWLPRLGPVWAVIASAAVYATLQMRPVLWPAAFIAGIGLALLAQSTGKLRSAVLAHFVYNALALVLSWTTIL